MRAAAVDPGVHDRGDVRLDDHGVIIEDRNGWDDVAAMRGSNTTLLGRHGTAWRRKRYDEAKKTLTDLNSRLSTLTTKFEKNLLADTNDLAIAFDSADDHLFEFARQFG